MPNKGKRIKSKANNPKKRNATSFQPGNQASKGVRGRAGKVTMSYDADELAARTIDKALVNKYFTVNSHLTLNQLREKYRSPNLSALEGMIVKSMILGAEQGDTGRIDFFLDRLIGKVPQKVDVTKTNRFENMTLEQLQAEKARLAEINQNRLRLMEQTDRVKQQERDVIEITANRESTSDKGA
jgi:hypothetical protein